MGRRDAGPRRGGARAGGGLCVGGAVWWGRRGWECGCGWHGGGCREVVLYVVVVREAWWESLVSTWLFCFK